RHGLPAPLLPPLPPLPALLPAHGARAVRAAGGRGGEAMSVGIERLQVYVPQYALRLTELAAARDIPPDKLTAGLGVQEMAIAPPGEPTQGAGAVAMLVGRAPQALVLSEQSGTYAGNVHDFWRPLDRREAIVDGKYSVECYLDALAGAFLAYRGLERPPLAAGEALSDRLGRLLYHTPFPKMAMKAHR